MQRLFRRWAGDLIGIAGLCLGLAVGAHVHAQDAGVDGDSSDDAGAPAMVLTPPELLETAQAPYPAQARAQGLQASVQLALTIDSAGQVTQAEVITPVGNGFDEAAHAAALRFRFAPASRDGQPIAARIRYTYVFELPTEPVVASAPPPAVVPNPPKPVEVSVLGQPGEAERLQRSAEAVNVIDTRIAKQQASDLGEVLARTQGVSVQREGGLGSATRFGLNGLYDEQVRFFVDGVPLLAAGYALGVADVPVNLLERVEVYRGVVPIRFGADALGGAVNLVTDQRARSHLNASYQLGSFGTHRLSANGRYFHEPSGLLVGGAGFFDHADNDYKVEVQAPDAEGRLHPETVTRKHDGYESFGGHVEVGVVDQPLAKRLFLRAFASKQDKEIQNNPTMTSPYGELRSSESVVGMNARYEVALLPNLDLELTGTYSHSNTNFVDKADWVYDWAGERGRMRRRGGETSATRKFDTLFWQDNLFARVVSQWKLSPEHSIRLASTPSAVDRSGDERVQNDSASRDPATAKRWLFTLVNGLEYEVDLFGQRLSNVAFVKDYVYRVEGEEPPLEILDSWQERKTDRHRLGAGDSLVFRVTPWLDAKASYEYATRLPSTDELFGSGEIGSPAGVTGDGSFLFLANLELKPEVSHNGNVGLRASHEHTRAGDLTVDVNAFVRDIDHLIMLFVSERTSQYRNLVSARALGVENALSWLSPGGYVGLNGMLTYQDVRNTSAEGTAGEFQGERVPNRPYLFGSWGARLNFERVFTRGDRLAPFYHGRYVHSFLRSWESLGRPEFKLDVDDQVVHSVGLTWSLTNTFAYLTGTLELDNLADAKVFDSYGAQRPGRAFYFKLSGELR